MLDIDIVVEMGERERKMILVSLDKEVKIFEGASAFHDKFAHEEPSQSIGIVENNKRLRMVVTGITRVGRKCDF
jgi:hypothetical protein